MRLRTATLALLALLLPATAHLALPAMADHDRPIQPGAEMLDPSGCTMNFVFADAAGKLFIGTAGHCADRVGEVVKLDGLAKDLGTVRWVGKDVDFSLVTIDPSLYGLVDPAVRHWGGPTGVATGAPPGVVYHYGYGIGYGLSEATRPRAGVLTLMDGERYLADTTATFGDSGSPVILADGRALGVISEYGFLDGHTDVGPTVGFILQRAKAEAGLTLTLLTAPLVPAGEREVAQAGHLAG